MKTKKLSATDTSAVALLRDFPSDTVLRKNRGPGPELFEVVSPEEVKLLEEARSVYERINAPFEGDSLQRIRRDIEAFREALVIHDDFAGNLAKWSCGQTVDSKAKVRAAMCRLINEMIADELGLNLSEQHQVIVNMMLHDAQDLKGKGTSAEKAARFFEHIAKDPCLKSP